MVKGSSFGDAERGWHRASAASDPWRAPAGGGVEPSRPTDDSVLWRSHRWWAIPVAVAAVGLVATVLYSFVDFLLWPTDDALSGACVRAVESRTHSSVRPISVEQEDTLRWRVTVTSTVTGAQATCEVYEGPGHVLDVRIVGP